MSINLIDLDIHESIAHEFKIKNWKDRLVINIEKKDQKLRLCTSFFQNKICLLLINSNSVFNENYISFNELTEPVKNLLVTLIQKTILDEMFWNKTILWNLENISINIAKILSSRIDKEVIVFKSESSPQDGDSWYTYDIWLNGDSANKILTINLEDLKK